MQPCLSRLPELAYQHDLRKAACGTSFAFELQGHRCSRCVGELFHRAVCLQIYLARKHSLPSSKISNHRQGNHCNHHCCVHKQYCSACRTDGIIDGLQLDRGGAILSDLMFMNFSKVCGCMIAEEPFTSSWQRLLLFPSLCCLCPYLCPWWMPHFSRLPLQKASPAENAPAQTDSSTQTLFMSGTCAVFVLRRSVLERTEWSKEHFIWKSVSGACTF